MRTIPMNKKLLAFGLSLGLTCLGGAATPGVAAAAPMSPAAFRMPAKSFAELSAQIAKARTVDPRAFVSVNGIVSHAPEADARARGRKAPVALYLAKLGPSALMPMLELLAVDAPRGIPAESAPGLRRDLIEAVGLLKDARALPVLYAILDDTTEDAATVRTVTEAVARMGTDEAAARIVGALDASKDADRTRSILAGMGECRRLRVADALASRLRSTTDEATARAAARSLGRAGNAWAWKTVADRRDEAKIRETAARALVDAYVRRDGEARYAASNALMVVDAPETPALVAEAKKGASPETAKALDTLAARFARNPTRTR
ncbi:MAG: HEAT repeat domain-containing protein [Labilithrix sp.]|nr:HEAT repeat domain-containing protein [Labilithrix sp.]